MKIKAIYKKKEMNPKEFRNFVRKTITEQAKSQQLNERYDDDENLGIYSGDFDPNEFGGEAMRAAMQDIGSEFEPLGQNRFEKNLNPDEFVADLKRQNLNLPNDQKELGDIEKTMAKKRAHEKMFGAGTLNETGEWSDDEEGNAWIEALRNELDLVQDMLAPGLYFIVKNVKGFDKYQGPYATIEINEDTYKVWTQENDELWIENFPVDNTSHEGAGKGFLGNAAAVADAINHYYSVLATMNEEFEEGPQPGDIEYHTEKPHYPKGIGKVDSIDWKTIFDDFLNNYKYFNSKGTEGRETTVSDLEESISRDEIALLISHDILEIEQGCPTLMPNFLDYKTFLFAVKANWGNWGTSDLNETLDDDGNFSESDLDGFQFDMKNLYSYFKDAMSSLKDYDSAIAAQILEAAFKRDLPYLSKHLSEGVEFPELMKQFRGNMDRETTQKNSNETPEEKQARISAKLTQLKARELDRRKEDDVIKEEEIEESMIRSHANGRGENLKPNNFPEEFERETMIDTLNENLDNAIDTDNDVFEVVDNDFNRAHYKDLIGQTFKDAPGYANVIVIEKPKAGEIPTGSIESDFHNAHQEPVEEEYDYAREERNFHDQENFKDLQQYTGKNLKIKNIDDMYNLVFPDKRRVQSVLDSLKEEINSMHIINDIVAASDYMDTDWLFDITGVDNENVYLDFTGTAK